MSDTPKKPPVPLVVQEPEMNGRAVMYVQTVFWVASYVQSQAKRTGLSQDQLIEEFGLNVRRTIDPDWRPDA